MGLNYCYKCNITWNFTFSQIRCACTLPKSLIYAKHDSHSKHLPSRPLHFYHTSDAQHPLTTTQYPYTHPTLRHPTTHPLSFSFHLIQVSTHIPQHPSLFPPIRKAIAIPVAVSSNTSIAPLAPTPSFPRKQHTHPLLHTLLYLLTALAHHFTAIASCIACTSPPSTLR